ncbi:hypothetical protein FHS42_004123 [Streptomyces zagrosensis]|uniref:Uncharacterized protein n=1 Tax=Streptomyces zagrosensis TaxID=1042984 RepID=A0A7W9QBU6_9ACTN|nr:hypothetical protein [Streptomyces zagrosensis]
MLAERLRTTGTRDGTTAGPSSAWGGGARDYRLTPEVREGIAANWPQNQIMNRRISTNTGIPDIIIPSTVALLLKVQQSNGREELQSCSGLLSQ